MSKSFWFLMTVATGALLVMIFSLVISSLGTISLISPLATFIPEHHVLSDQEPKKISVLLLGLDARHGDKKPRCDAIHMITFDFQKQKTRIISIPRGTKINLPETSEESAYLGNACHIKGIDFAKKRIRDITGIQPDYTVKLGFSQVIGIFRTLGFPTTDSLKYLRNRSLPGGDLQRTHNQALFIKDLMLNELDRVSRLPKPMHFLLYRMVDADIDFETAENLFELLLKGNMYKNPDNIELVTQPFSFLGVRDMHFMVSRSDIHNDEEFVTYQKGLEQYFQDLVVESKALVSAKQPKNAYERIKTPFSQQLWLQLEDEEKREIWHFELLRLFVVTADNKKDRRSALEDYILEMKVARRSEYESRGQKLLGDIGQ